MNASLEGGMTDSASARVLIVGDEIAQMQSLCRTLELHGYEARGFASATEALTKLRPGRYDMLLTDLQMPQIDGFTLMSAARRIDPDIACVVMTGQDTAESAARAMQMGALDYLQKPFNADAVVAVTHRALEVRRLRIENAQLLHRERECARELAIANRDLDSFSAIVSHDLRAPLRSISGFAAMFRDDYGSTLDSQAQRLFDPIVGGAARMDTLIDDLLRFCRSGRQPLRKIHADCNQVINRALLSLQEVQKGRELVLHMEDLHGCDADPSLLEQVFVQLLSNAFKFTRDRHPAVVEVGSLTRAGEYIIFVRDNGAGFDLRYAGRLFEVFQRMHPQNAFEGSGVGLAIVRRIVERHGGRIWAESEPDKGATFYFTLSPSSNAASTNVEAKH
jgi:signal transduction histidine kinase